MTKEEKTDHLVQRAVEAFKIQAAPKAMHEAADILAYYAVFDSPATWRPGNRMPQETLVPAVKLAARFKRSFGN